MFAAGAVLFAGILGLLGVRTVQGHDPAIGAGQGAATSAKAGPPRVVRRIIVTRRVIIVRPAPRVAASQGSPAVAAAPAPVGPASAPTPAPVQSAPAPAPAPPPVQSSSS